MQLDEWRSQRLADMTVCRSVLSSFIVFVSTVHSVFAQTVNTSAGPEVSIGFVESISWNTDIEIVRGQVTRVPGLWTDFSVAVSKRARLHVAAELSASSEVVGRHPGSAGYVVTYQHREIPIVSLVGLRLNVDERFQTLLLVGGGIVLWRTTTTFQRTSPFQPGVPLISDNNTAAVAVAGGIEFQTAVSERAALVGRVLARVGRGGAPLDSNPFVGSFGPFVLSPAIGVRLRL